MHGFKMADPSNVQIKGYNSATCRCIELKFGMVLAGSALQYNLNANKKFKMATKDDLKIAIFRRIDY